MLFLRCMLRDDVSGEGLDNPDFDNSASEMPDERENQAEILRLKAMLHQKEMELSLLKQQIEKEQFSLSVLHNKAITEVRNAQNIMSAKDEELRATEESLAGLKEVQIEYWGNGETVEVAGSFNGWHHRIKMDLNPSSKVMSPIRRRESALWLTTLWLYPGIYEIKFIVDGQWSIDSQLEYITKGNITNNILRVER